MDHLTTILAYASVVMVIYYLGFFALSLRTNRRARLKTARRGATRFVVVIPAHNEELVIEQTVRRLRELEDEPFVALVMNDGSRDNTAELARRAADGDERFIVVDRSPAIAGRGKGEVLNHAYRLVSRMIAWGDPRFAGATPDSVVLCVVDADGWLEPHALREVAPYFADADVGGVQLPVRMWNAGDGFLALMQDIEFVGFCRLVQAGRDPLGSVGLGGNGQFIRLSALQQLGDAPWSKCLTEDLDVTMHLIRRGWRLRFCPRAAVAQQALTAPRPLFRQRARWVQGHYTCWRHLLPLLRARGVPLVRRLDAAFYLFNIVAVIVFATLFGASLATYVGLATIYPTTWDFIASDGLYLALTLSLSLLPLACVIATYRVSAAHPVPWWATPGVFLVFIFYGYAWAVPATARALARIGLGRDRWAKTPRVAVTAQALVNEQAALGRVPAR